MPAGLTVIFYKWIASKCDNMEFVLLRFLTWSSDIFHHVLVIGKEMRVPGFVNFA